MWILAAKPPDSDLNFAVDFWMLFSSFLFHGKGPKNSTKKPAKFTPDFVQTNSLGFLQRPFLEFKQLDGRLIGVVRQHSVLRRVLRRFWEGFWGRVLRRVLRRGPAMAFTVKQGSEKIRRGSEKGVSRRCLEPPSENATLRPKLQSLEKRP